MKKAIGIYDDLLIIDNDKEGVVFNKTGDGVRFYIRGQRYSDVRSDWLQLDKKEATVLADWLATIVDMP